MIRRKVLVQYEVKRGEASTPLARIEWNPDYGCSFIEEKVFLSTNDIKDVLKMMQEIESEQNGD